MISWTDVNLLQNQKLEKQVKLNELLNSNILDLDRINELKSEILYLDKQIKKILGSKEIERQEILKGRKLENLHVDKYYSLKYKVSKIRPMTHATNRIIKLIDLMETEKNAVEDMNMDRVRVKAA